MSTVILPDLFRRLPNPHLVRLQQLIGSSANQSISAPDVHLLFLCFTNRCGSNFVAELLSSTGCFNLAGEFLNYDTVLRHVEAHRLPSLSHYFHFLCDNLSRDGRLTVKLAAAHLVLLYDAGILPQIIDRSKFLVIERNDRLMQAISLSIASQTGQWTSYMESRTHLDDLVFSQSQIIDIINNTVEQQRCFDLFFAMNGIQQHTLIYEQMASNPDIHIPILSQWLGVNINTIDTQKLRLRRQASSLSLLWRDRFLAER